MRSPQTVHTTIAVCPTWLRSWIPTPIRSVADSVLGVAASTVGAVVSAVAGRDAHVRGEDENDPHIPRDGERVQLEVSVLAHRRFSLILFGHKSYISSLEE